MLLHLSVRDFAIIEHLQLELGGGAIALTGETGAGKSILIDALELALGVRAQASMVRSGAKQAEVIAEFALTGHRAARHWLQQHELSLSEVGAEDADESCLLRRTVSLDGRSRGWINGRLAPAQMLRELGEQLVRIYAQNSQQSLMRADLQRAILDQYANHQPLQQQAQQLYQRLKQQQAAMAESQGAMQQQAQLDYLHFQQQEMAQVEITADKIQQLTALQRRLAHRETIIQALYQAQEQLDGETNAASARTSLVIAQRHLEVAAEHGAEVTESMAALGAMVVTLDDTVSTLRHYATGVDCDAAHLAAIDQQLARIDDLARKYRVDPLALAALKASIDEQISGLEANQTQLAELEQQQTATTAAYHQAAAALSASRQQAASALASAVTSEMQQLGMAQAVFSVTVEHHPQRPPAVVGQDTIAFCVCTNPGQRSGPLSAIASGGELSRIALALHVVGLRESSAQTLIFDEVDNGIGGGVGETVGQALARLGNYHQVLYITHLPQVAVHAAQHLRIRKSAVANTTQIDIEMLDIRQREVEIARMSAGQRITQHSLQHARGMLKRRED